MKIKFTLFLISSLCYIQHGLSQSALIIGGQEADEEEYPWMVELIASNAHHCGATLIAPSWVLTAAHCAIDMPSLGVVKPNKVIINSIYNNSATGNAVEVDIEEYHLFPDFDINTFNLDLDIALLKLAEPVTTIVPVQTTIDNPVSLELQDDVLALGWGSINTSGTGSEILKEAIPKIKELAPNVIKAGYDAGETPAGAGAGDSGGPLLYELNGELIQVGLVSGGDGVVTQAGSPGVFTRISHYSDWASSVMSDPVGISEPESEIKFGFVNNHLQIKNTSDKTNLTYSIIDVNGRQVYTNVINQQGITTQALPYLESGIYFLNVNDHKNFNVKLIKL